MGSCWGSSCVSKEPQEVFAGNDISSYTSCFGRQQATGDEQDAELISNSSERCRRRGLIYRILRFKTKKKYPHFIDKILDRQNIDYSKLANPNNSNNLDAQADIQLQNLDVYKLLNSSALAKESELNQCARVTNSSRASSSLDLEWEHEYTQLRQYQLQNQQHQRRREQLLMQLQMDSSDGGRSSCEPQQAGATTYHAYSSCDQLSMMPTPAHGYASLSSLPANTPMGVTHQPPTTASMLPTTATYTTQLANLSSSRVTGASGLRHYRHTGGAVTRHGSFTRTSCGSSQTSTPESLEWDIDEEQEQQRHLRVEDDNLDDETLKLLHQIEQLKHQVLQETGEGLDSAADECSNDGLAFSTHHFGCAGELETAQIS